MVVEAAAVLAALAEVVMLLALGVMAAWELHLQLLGFRLGMPAAALVRFILREAPQVLRHMAAAAMAKMAQQIQVAALAVVEAVIRGQMAAPAS